MLFFLLGFILAVTTTSLAAPSTLTRRACKTVLNGHLSPPNGVSGNFGLIKGGLAFNPMDLAMQFPISLQDCGSSSVQLVANATNQCLVSHNATAMLGPTVMAVDCSTATSTVSTSWAMSNGTLFWTGEPTSSCVSGLYGFQAVGLSGTPSAVQKAPVTLACSTDSNVFGFSV